MKESSFPISEYVIGAAPIAIPMWPWPALLIESSAIPCIEAMVFLSIVISYALTISFSFLYGPYPLILAMIPSTIIPRYRTADEARIAYLEINPNRPGNAPIAKSVSPQFSELIADVDDPPFVAKSLSSGDVSGTQCPARKIIGMNVMISP